MKFIKKNGIYIGSGFLMLLVLCWIICNFYIPEHPKQGNYYPYFREFFELLSFISLTLGVVGILYAYKSYNDLQKGINFTVINGCMTRYTAILPSLIKIELEKDMNDVKQETTVRSYLDLANEQLYYIGIGIIPAPIEKMWVDGIRRQTKKLEKSPGGIEGEQGYNNDYPFLKLLEKNPEVPVSKLKRLFKDHINQ